jgi:hypothetical protein
MANLTCQACGNDFVGRADAKTCSNACKKRRLKNPGIAQEEPSDALIAAVELELEKHGAVDSRPGQQAIQLAKMMSGKFAMATGVASISKELDRMIRVAIEESVVVADPLDELRRRREAKRAS